MLNRFFEKIKAINLSFKDNFMIFIKFTYTRLIFTRILLLTKPKKRNYFHIRIKEGNWEVLTIRTYLY